MKRSRTAILLVLASAGSGAAGYLFGRGTEAASEVPRRAAQERVAYEPAWSPPGDFGEVSEPPPPAAPSPSPEEEASAPEPVDPASLADALARDPASPYAQKLLDALVAQAATNPRAALPKLRELLASGVDVAVTSLRADGTGYPTLRVALLDALAATGDPAAIDALAEVARTSGSPVEVIFSAHLLDRLEGMDQATARLALQALTKELSPAERKALGSVLRQVAPAAARADPSFAEAVLAERLRLPGDVRLLVPALDGLPEARARQVVLEALAAPDVPERSKSAVAVHAAAARASDAVSEVRRAVENGALPANAVAAAARASVYAPAFDRMRGEARRAVRSGDLARAERIADEMQRRLLEARALVAAGRARGVRIPAELDKRGSIVEDWLQAARALVARERARLATPR